VPPLLVAFFIIWGNPGGASFTAKMYYIFPDESTGCVSKEADGRLPGNGFQRIDGLVCLKRFNYADRIGYFLSALVLFL
jgi:hypothetical protein